MLVNNNDHWRLIKNQDKGKYCFLIGANKWAVELEESEFNSLYFLINDLINEFLAIKDELMEEELINLEFEKQPWYAELEGTKREWSLRMILECNENSRSFEMYWPIQIAETLSFEIIKMWDSMH